MSRRPIPQTPAHQAQAARRLERHRVTINAQSWERLRAMGARSEPRWLDGRGYEIEIDGDVKHCLSILDTDINRAIEIACSQKFGHA